MKRNKVDFATLRIMRRQNLPPRLVAYMRRCVEPGSCHHMGGGGGVASTSRMQDANCIDASTGAKDGDTDFSESNHRPDMDKSRFQQVRRQN